MDPGTIATPMKDIVAETRHLSEPNHKSTCLALFSLFLSST